MNYRKFLITSLTFIGGIYFFFEFVLPDKLPPSLGGFEFGRYHTEISNGFIAIGAVAFALGLINLFYVHGSRIIFVRKGAQNSAALLLSLLIMMFLTLNEWISSEKVNASTSKLRSLASFADQIKIDAEKQSSAVMSAAERVKLLITALAAELKLVEETLAHRDPAISQYLYEDLEKSLAAAQKESGKVEQELEQNSTVAMLSRLTALAQSVNALAPARQKVNELAYRTSSAKLTYDFVYEGFFVPLGSAMFSLLGFYIISAGYRAFRIRSTESALMMIAALVVMLGQIPFYIYISDRLPEIRLWLLEIPSAAAFRAVKFGTAIAALYMAVRMWMSIETASFIENGKESDQ